MSLFTYRKTDVYKTIKNSKANAELLGSVAKMSQGNRFSAGFKNSITELVGDVTGGSLGNKALAISALMYLVMPMDMVPDFIPLTGFADDMFVIGTILMKIKG